MHIGLIGGIGPAATNFYYNELLRQALNRDCQLELTIAHADLPSLLHNLSQNNISEQCDTYLKLTERLAIAGADCVAVTSIAGHFCIDSFKLRSPLPLIDISDAVVSHLLEKNIQRVGILGTAQVMSTGMFGKLGQISVLAPEEGALSGVNEAYISLALKGFAEEEVHSTLKAEGLRLTEKGAETVLLAGTDLSALFVEQPPSFPVLDCAAVHVSAILESLEE